MRAETLPRVDRAKLREHWFAGVVEEVADAVDAAPAARVIRDSEEKARDALGRFRQVVDERVLQEKVDATSAAFPPPFSPAAGRRKRHKGRQAYSVLTVNGLVGSGMFVGTARWVAVKRRRTGSATKRCEMHPAIASGHRVRDGVCDFKRQRFS